jgi:hypothetical protein
MNVETEERRKLNDITVEASPNLPNSEAEVEQSSQISVFIDVPTNTTNTNINVDDSHAGAFDFQRFLQFQDGREPHDYGNFLQQFNLAGIPNPFISDDDKLEIVFLSFGFLIMFAVVVIALNFAGFFTIPKILPEIFGPNS